jgi:hypothetical protein
MITNLSFRPPKRTLNYLAMEENKVRIVEWPKSKAFLEHTFQLDKPCPVSILFEDKPVPVEVNTDQKKPMNVAMNMAVSAKEAIPVCIKICEPICAVSDYKVGITLFGQPLAEIGVKGTTRLAACEDNEKQERICLRFEDCKSGKVAKSPYNRDGVTYSTQSATVRFVSLIGPPTPTQMLIENDLLRLDFDEPVSQLELSVANFGDPIISIEALSGETQLFSDQIAIQNSQQKILVPVDNVKTILLSGGSNEAGLIELCFDSKA